MSNLYISIFFSFSQIESFGINFNLFETNIFNLVIVLGVLVYYGSPLCFYLSNLFNFNLKILCF